MSGGKYEGQGMMVGHRGEGEHGLLIIRQHGVEEQYSNDGQDSMVVRQHNNQESHTDGIIVRHGQVKHTEGHKSGCRIYQLKFENFSRSRVMRA